MQIGVAQVNPSLGAFRANADKIIDFIGRAQGHSCDLLVFPECALFGYSPFDLLDCEYLVDEQLKQIERIQKKLPRGMGVIFGAISKNTKERGKPFFNSAFFLQGGKRPQVFHKTLLPTGDVFDEHRYMEFGSMKDNFIVFKGRKFFISICEDIWGWKQKGEKSPYAENPIERVRPQKVDLVINLSASPFYLGKVEQREKMAKATGKHFNAPALYVNLVGAQDEIIFDGHSFLVDLRRDRINLGSGFIEDLNFFHLDSLNDCTPRGESSDIEQVRQALVLGIRDFTHKIGINKVHLGLSGGIDSAVVACLATDALSPEKVKAMSLPGPYSSKESHELAENLAKNLGVEFFSLSINDSYDTILRAYKNSFGAIDFGVTHENLQARLRGLSLMMYANSNNSLLLTTGNKSEYATGYATLYGDMCGGLAPLGDLTKKQVYELARYYNRNEEKIPQKIIDRAPTAELRPNQTDQDSLPSYDELDKAVENLVEFSKKPKSKVEKWLADKIYRSEFKRWQAPPILKVSQRSFGRGRRWPIAKFLIDL